MTIDVEARTPRERERRRRLRRIVLVVAGTLAALLVLAGIKAYVLPHEDPVDNADAIIALGGFGTPPIHRALELAESGVADIVVVSDPYDPNTDTSRAACAASYDFEVICFRPNPNTTQGEARQIRALMEQRGWDNVVILTATYHVTRARIIVERCVPEGAQFIAAKTPTKWNDWAYNFLYQTAGLAKLAVTSGC